MNAQDLISHARQQQRSALDEAAGKALLSAYGVAVPNTVVVKDADALGDAIRALRFPVVVKVISSEILHKSDAGGVRVNVMSVDEVRAAIRSMSTLPAIAKASVEGWLV